MFGSEIVGLGTYVPERVVTNDDLSKMIDTSDEWITKRTGIKERRWVVDTDGGTASLGVFAAKKAIAMAGLKPSDIDMIIGATQTPDYYIPGIAPMFQHGLELRGKATLDIRNQCTGFVYGLSVADQFIRTGAMKNVLVVGAELQSRGLDVTNNGRDIAVLFGDGAGAAVLTATEGTSRIIDSKLHADGELADILAVTRPGTRGGNFINEEHLANGDHYPSMDGQSVFRQAVGKVPEVILEVVESNGYTLDDIDVLIPHQANQRINDMVARLLKVPKEKVFNNIQKYGNTTAASIPLALTEAVECGAVKKGDLVVLAAFGAGLTWGANLIRW